MIKSLGRAEQAMLMQQIRVDALANNLANVNSAGFRQVLTRAVLGPDDIAGGDTPDRTRVRGMRGGGQPLVQETTLRQVLDTRPGQVRATGRELDVAVMDKGWFVIQTPDGESYTRDGSFVLDSQRRLTTPDGYPVLGSGGPIVLEGNAFAVEHDGTITVDGQNAGRLRLVDFDDPNQLVHKGGSLLTAPEAAGVSDVPAEQIVVAQGHLEGSNVSAVDTLVAMIAAQRAFEVQSKVLTTQDTMLDKSVNTLSRAGRS
ncbi:MAG: flagellar hook-basal body protein [bacterium]|nr:flagellar hook-basal body protein [bacterium]